MSPYERYKFNIPNSGYNYEMRFCGRHLLIFAKNLNTSPKAKIPAQNIIEIGLKLLGYL